MRSRVKSRLHLFFYVPQAVISPFNDSHYHLQLTYNKSDTMELVIRVLSFGPLLKLVRPEELEDKEQREQQLWFWRELQRRLQKQTELLTQ